MFTLIIGLLLFVAAILIVWFDEGHDKGFITLSIVVGTVFIVMSVWAISMPQINEATKPIRMGTSDTLYVVPKGGTEGVALIATRDSTGKRTIVVRGFVAEHKIAPAIK